MAKENLVKMLHTFASSGSFQVFSNENERAWRKSYANAITIFKYKERTKPMTHKTHDGKVYLLAELENGHLMNIINLKLETLGIAKQVLGETAKRNKFDEALYGEVMNEENARDFVASFDRNIAPYLAEALIRELEVSTFVKSYQELIGRKSKIKISYLQRQKLLDREPNYGDFEDDRDE